MIPLSDDSQNPAGAVRAAQKARFAAMMDEDVAALDVLLADELVYTHASGRVESKAAFLSAVASDRYSYESIRPYDVEVQIHGKTAVAAGGSDMEVQIGERLHVFTIRFTEVHVLREGRWQMTAWHSTRLPDPKS